MKAIMQYDQAKLSRAIDACASNVSLFPIKTKT